MARVEDSLAPITVQQHMRTFRHFVRWCESVEIVDQGVGDLIRIPDTSKDERSRDTSISAKRARSILQYLRKFNYCSIQHLFFGLIWQTGMRIGSVHALDVDDVNHDRSGSLYLELRHRPETGTPLKLGKEGERHITVGDGPLSKAIEDWLQHERPDIVDEQGRSPLLVTSRGRASKTTLRVACYKATHPCLLDECPHGKEQKTCKHRSHERAGGCPSSVNPHAIRRSAITHQLDEGMPKDLVSERCNVSPDTLDEHYDARSEEQKRQNRTRYIDDMRF
jgi:integrase